MSLYGGVLSIAANVLRLGGRFNAAKPLLGDRYFFVRWDLQILIRTKNEKQKFKP